MEQTALVKNVTGTVIVVGMTLSAMSFNSSRFINPISINSLNNIAVHLEAPYYSSDKNVQREFYNIYELNETKLEREARLIFGEMREATREEVSSIESYVKKISKDTGVNFFDLC